MNSLCVALGKIPKHCGLASTIRWRRCSKTSIKDSQVVEVSIAPYHEMRVLDKLDNIKHEFAMFVLEVKAEVQEDEELFKKVKSYVDVRFPSVIKLSCFCDTDELFAFLRERWSFMRHPILRHVIMSFISQLRGSFENYEKKLKAFTKSMLIKDF